MAALFSGFPFWVQTVFLPLNAEKMAATKHSTAAIMNASVSAVMKGEDIALGKKVWLVRMFSVFWGRLEATVGPML